MKKIIIFILLFLIPTTIIAHNNKQVLKGITIVIDAGHGGMDKGTSSQNVEEAPLNLIITKKLEKELLQLGCNVVLTRKDENDLSSSNRFSKSEDMKERIRIINDEKNDIFISIHMNQFQNPTVKGLHVFYNPASNQSLEFASIMQKEVNQQLKQNKQMKKGDFYILNKTRIPGILIECGFLSNNEDRNHLLDEKYQDKIVNCFIKGIIQYFENKNII